MECIRSLAEKIRSLERRHSMSGGERGFRRNRAGELMPTAWEEIDAVLGGGLAAGALHEWFVVDHSQRDTQVAEPHRVARSDPGSPGAGRGATRKGWSAPRCLMAHLAWQALRQRTAALWAVWIGRACFPYPRVLIRDGGVDASLFHRSIWVSADRIEDRLWAVDLALRSPVVGVVIADGSGFDMAATRRIQLIARDRGAPAMLVRPPGETANLSAAVSRWRVGWVPSARSPDTSTEGPRWTLELLRCKGVQPERGPRVWTLEWDRAESVVRLSAAMAHPTRDAKTSAGATAGESAAEREVVATRSA